MAQSFNELSAMDRRGFLTGLLASAVALGAFPRLGITKFELARPDPLPVAQGDMYQYGVGALIELTGFDNPATNGTYRVTHEILTPESRLLKLTPHERSGLALEMEV